MISFVATGQTNEPQVGADNLPTWLLNSRAADLPVDFLKKLGQDLERHKDELVKELDLPPQVSLIKGLNTWTDRSGSTLFVLIGALTSVGRADWIKKIKDVMEMHLYVRVCEQGCRDVHYKVSTSSESSVRCALENTLGWDLTHYQIVGPNKWTHWHTMARELKGQQLTLQKLHQEVIHCQPALYGLHATPRYPNTMPPNIPGGGDANYNIDQPLKEHEIEKLKLASGSNTTFSDNLMEEGLSELANAGSSHKEAGDLTFDSMSLPDTKEELTLDENTHEKVPMRRALIEPVKNLSLNKHCIFFANVPCDTPEDNVNFINLIPHDTILNHGDSCPIQDTCDRVLNNVPNLSMLQSSISRDSQQQSKQNNLNWNCGQSSSSLNGHTSRNYGVRDQLEVQINSAQYGRNPSPDGNWCFNDKYLTAPNLMDGSVREEDDSKSSVDMDQNLEPNVLAKNSNPQIMSSNKHIENKYTSEINQICLPVSSNCQQTDVSVCSGPEYVSHSQIMRVRSVPKDIGAKRSNVPSPLGSPNMGRIKRQKSVSDLDDMEEVQETSPINSVPAIQNEKSVRHDLIIESQMQKETAFASHVDERSLCEMDMAYKKADSTFRPPLLHADTQQLDFQNVPTVSSMNQGVPSYANILPPKPIIYENVPKSEDPEKWNQEPQFFSMKESQSDLSCISGEIPETPLLCHTPPPSFPESTAPTFATSTPSTSTPIVSSRPATQSQPRVQYSNTEAFLPAGSVVFSRDNGRASGVRPGGATAVIHSRTVSAGLVSETSYMDMTQGQQPLATSLPVTGRPVATTSLPNKVQTQTQRSSPPHPVPPQHPPPKLPPRGVGPSHGAGVYITTSNHSPTGPHDGYSGLEDEHYNYIDPQTPGLPPRGASLEVQLKKIPGWSPHINGSTVQSIMKDYQSTDGNFVIWRSRRLNLFIITVSHLGNLVHYCVQEMPGPGRSTIYFLYENGYRSDSMLEMVHHYIQCGIRKPVSSGPGGKRYMDHIRLRRPLVVETRPRPQKGASTSK